MYPPPQDSLTEATFRELDGQFFTSDPYAYLRLRIRSLLTTEGVPVPGGDVAEEFSRLLGPSAAHYNSVDERMRKLQVAVDAFALRHQVAETLLRFLHMVLHHQAGHSHWVELTDTPTSNRDVYQQIHATLTVEGTDGEALLRSVLLPPAFTKTAFTVAEPNQTGLSGDDDLVDRALGVHVAWINYAIMMFTQRSPDLDAAHNKFKHGIGLRPQDDVLSTLTLTPPNSNGGVAPSPGTKPSTCSPASAPSSSPAATAKAAWRLPRSR